MTIYYCAQSPDDYLEVNELSNKREYSFIIEENGSIKEVILNKSDLKKLKLLLDDYLD